MNMTSGSHQTQSNKLTLIGVIGFFALIILITFLAGKVDTLSQEQPPANEIRYSNAQKVYIPVYSHIFRCGGKDIYLETTLSIRNTDPRQAITIRRVDYFGTSGKLIARHLEEPREVMPMATIDFRIEQDDACGGSGANFIVEWDAEESVYQPIIEAVLIGDEGVSLISKGRPLAKAPE